MDDFEKELAEAIGQRNASWHKERLGRFTGSKFGELMKTGRSSTAQKRKQAEKDLKSGEITQSVYDRTIRELDQEDYEARFGQGCKTYVYEKIAEMLTNSVHMTGGSAATEWGSDLEAEAVQFYMNKTGRIIKPQGFIKYGELCGCSPDGKIIGENGIIEVKCPFNPANHVRTLLTNTIDDRYFYQVHGNMLMTGSDFCDFVSYDPRMQDEHNKMVIIRVDKDEAIRREILDRIKEVGTYMKKLYELTF